MLKKVVFPAPFGPIRLTILPWGMVKSTSSTATRPPNSLRNCSTWTMSLMLEVIERLVVDSHLELGLPPSTGYQALGPEQHHHHQDDAEDPELVLRHLDVQRQVLVQPCAGIRQSLAVEVGEEGGAEDDAPDVPHAAEDDHAEDEHGDVEEEVPGERRTLEARVVGARDSAEERAGRVRPCLRAHQRHAHRRCRRLVLPNCDPCSAEPRLEQPEAAEDGEQDE